MSALGAIPVIQSKPRAQLKRPPPTDSPRTLVAPRCPPPLKSPRMNPTSLGDNPSPCEKFLKSAEANITHEARKSQDNGSQKKERHSSLKRYQRTILGIDPDSAEDNIGKSKTDNDNETQLVSTGPDGGNQPAEESEITQDAQTANSDTGLEDTKNAPPNPRWNVSTGNNMEIEPTNTRDVSTVTDTLSKDELESLQLAEIEAEKEESKLGIPSVHELLRTGFGKPSKNHSFTQEASFETTLFQVIKVGRHYMTEKDFSNLRATHPLVDHLAKMTIWLSDPAKRIDFSKLREYDLAYASQTEIPPERVKMFMACLFHYNLSVASVMRYAGNNYTGGYRNVRKMVDKMRGLVDDELLTHYIRVMELGAPAYFVAESTRENAMTHWRKGNHASVEQNMDKVLTAMNKLEKHDFVIPIPSWLARFIPHLFFTPTHLMFRPGKDPRFIYDASRRFTPTSVPINRMTSTHLGVEFSCEYGTVFQRLMIRIWNLRITYPKQDIIIHANDVKSCFRQMKHHPDVMGAFSYIIADLLYLSCALTFGSDFSPQTWEIPRRIAEQLATQLFHDKSLVAKHRSRLDQLKWSKQLGKGKASDFVPAHANERFKGVLDEKTGELTPTPHHLFVDDDLYAELFDKARVEQTVAAGIEAIFMILGESDLARRQDPISWDKLLEMVIHYKNVALGQLVNTRDMTVETPPEFIAKVVKLLNTTWRGGTNGRKSFKLKEAEILAGLLIHVSNTALWLKHLMSHVFTSIAAALKGNTSYLICTNKHFREQIKLAKSEALTETEEMHKTFAQAETARKIHNFQRQHWILPTLHDELDIIREALSSNEVNKASPIAHLIPGIENGNAFGDSSLDSAGGWSIPMKFWWWYDWPEDIRKRTLRYVKDGKSGKLIDINALEYATILINYAACVHFWVTEGNCSVQNIPFPRVTILADNKSSEFWATKGCKRSLIGRRLGRLQCAMMINNPVGLDTGHVDTKTNVIADRISRWKRESDTLLGFDTLVQEFPQLKCCRRFHPSSELISLILDALQSEKLVNPLQVRQLLLKNPGRIAS